MMTSHPLKTYRLANDQTQEALAAVLNVSVPTLSRWETRARQISAAQAVWIEKALGIPRHELRPDLWALTVA
jgi:DNA-binding transcriptional regulator YdaS (Cro superfamily)